MIEQRERETYETVWALRAYHNESPGRLYAPLFLQMIAPIVAPAEHPWYAAEDYSILDAGCGAGDGAIELRTHGFQKIKLCDITDEGLLEDALDYPFYQVALWDSLNEKIGYMHGGKMDFVYCCDVLEHIPPHFTMLVVSRLLDISRYGVFLTISLLADNFGAWVGKPLHQTLQSFSAWRDQLDTVGHVREARDLLGVGVYFVEPK